MVFGVSLVGFARLSFLSFCFALILSFLRCVFLGFCFGFGRLVCSSLDLPSFPRGKLLLEVGAHPEAAVVPRFA